MRLVGCTQERQLSAGPILAAQGAARPEIYHMLKDGTLYQDLGSNHFQNRSKGQQTNRLIKRLADLGYDVVLTPRTS
jgi:hypothetical protein